MTFSAGASANPVSLMVVLATSLASRTASLAVEFGGLTLPNALGASTSSSFLVTLSMSAIGAVNALTAVTKLPVYVLACVTSRSFAYTAMVDLP